MQAFIWVGEGEKLEPLVYLQFKAQGDYFHAKIEQNFLLINNICLFKNVYLLCNRLHHSLFNEVEL